MFGIRQAVRSASFALALGAGSTLTATVMAQDVAPPEEGGRDLTRFVGQVGGTWSSGNSRTTSVNAAVRTSARIGDNEFTFSGALSYGQSRAAPKGSGPDAEQQDFETDGLFYGRLRYDRVFLEKNSFFVAMLGFRDTSSGFRSRYNPYAGYQRVLFTVPEAAEVWLEGGYRTSFEHLLLDERARQDGLTEHRIIHGPFALLGSVLKASETLDVDLGLEVQQAVNEARDFRVIGIASLMNRVAGSLFLGMNFNLRYLRAPIGDREPLDTQLQVVVLFDHAIKGKKKS